MSGTYLNMNAWQEIQARVFEGFTVQSNVSPNWLINPATRRKLKLDHYYPEAAIALRNVGLTAKGQGRQSDWDLMEEQQRDQTRQELCKVNGVQLILLDPLDDPVKQMDGLIRVMSRASRELAQSSRPDKEKKKWMPALGAARDRATALRTQITKDPEQAMAVLAEGWRDREAGLASSLQAASAEAAQRSRSQARSRKLPTFKLEQRVEHSHFGPGVITQIEGAGDEARISVLFDASQERTFLLRLVVDKLSAGS